jgi:multiple sugar transport system ATP-binding protein
MADIVINKIAKSFGAHRALDEISIRVADGEFLSLLGPSGCGKTTLLRIIAGLETETTGDVIIGGRNLKGVAPRHRGLAMVFQNYAVFPHMTVFDNIAFGLSMQNKPADAMKARVGKVAELLHITPYLERYPAKLSGGQRQRVAVARALAVEPAVLLMDEPLSNLDALLRMEMRTELRAVLRASGTTTVYVTHDQSEAMGLSDRIAVMYGGRIDQIGTPLEVYATPATRFVGSFMGNPPMNFLSAVARDGAVSIGGLTLLSPIKNGAVEIGLRGEDTALAPTLDNAITMRVRAVEPMGSHLLITGLIAEQPVRVVAPPAASVTMDTDIGLAVNPTRLTWIDPATGKAVPPCHP